MDIKEQMSRLACSGLEFAKKQQAEAFMSWFAEHHGKSVRRYVYLGDDAHGEKLVIEHEKLTFGVQGTESSPWQPDAPCRGPRSPRSAVSWKRHPAARPLPVHLGASWRVYWTWFSVLQRP